LQKQNAAITSRILYKSSLVPLLGLLLVILFWQYSQNRKTSLRYLDQEGVVHELILPVQEKIRLASWIQNLFSEDNFAYTTLGSKSISWATYQNPLPVAGWRRCCASFSKYNRTLRNGWKTWEKYQHLFPSADIWMERSTSHPGSSYLLIIHEDRFNEIVMRHRDTFQKILSREITDGFQLLQEAKTSSLIDDVLQEHQVLIGTVLGYGEENSWKFLRSCESRIPYGWVWGDEEHYFDGISVAEDAPVTERYLARYSCPSFSGHVNSEESIALKKEYLLTRKKLLEYYKDKDFLEATLSLLAGYRPPT